MRIQILFFSLLYVLAFSRCIAFNGNRDTLIAEGTVYIGIPESLDGCGHMIMIDSVLYKAVGIPEHVLENEKKLRFEYVSEGFFYCGRGKRKIEQIRIVAIKPE